MGPIMATTPSRTGSSVLAAAWAMGAEPWPDSLLNRPRLTPQVSMKMNVPPAKPPICAAGLKAVRTISTSSPGISWKWSTSTMSAPAT